MPQWRKIFPGRWPVIGALDNSLSAVSDLTAGANWNTLDPHQEFPGTFGRSGGAGGGTSIRITANNTATQDHEILGLLTGPLNVNQNGQVMCRSTASWTTSPNGIVRAYIWGDGRVYVERVTTGGSVATVGTIDLAALGRSTRPILCRLRVSGAAGSTRVQCKAWSMTQAEPGAWDVDQTLSVTLNADGYPVLARQSSGFLASLGSFSVGTAGDSAPDITRAISGTVRVGLTGVARTVRAVAREDAHHVYETTSAADGSYTLRVIRGFNYTVYALDSLAGDYNAVVLDKIDAT